MSLLAELLNEDVLGRPAREKKPNPLLEVQAPPVAKREVFIAIRRDGNVGDGTLTSPYNGSNRDILDRILNGAIDPTVLLPVRFVFGPGIFRTGGGWQNSAEPGIWLGVRTGQEFVGAGMFATTLRLEIPAPLENASYGGCFQNSWKFLGLSLFR